MLDLMLDLWWKKWIKDGGEFPPKGNICPRCKNSMDEGFWMHCCPPDIEMRENRLKLYVDVYGQD